VATPRGMAVQWPHDGSRYRIGAKIGVGACAKVVKALVTPDGEAEEQSVAIKMINLEQCPLDGSWDNVARELQVMRSCCHENIVTYHCCFCPPPGKILWLVMPFMGGGSAADLLRGPRERPQGIGDERIMAFILRETARALVHLHSTKHLHRDLKAANILLGLDGIVKLSDFGVAANQLERAQRITLVGTPCWMAPEVLVAEEVGGYDTRADVWSFGITAIELAEGCAPHQRLPPLKVLHTILEEPPPQLSTRLEPRPSDLYYAIVRACLDKCRETRPTIVDIMDKHRAFFDQATPSGGKSGQQALAERLAAVPPLEMRFAETQNFRRQSERHSRRMNHSGDHKHSPDRAMSDGSSWDFDIPQDEMEFDAGVVGPCSIAEDFPDLGEVEADGP